MVIHIVNYHSVSGREPIQMTNYNFSDEHDYFNEIDEGYLNISQFLYYNQLRKMYRTHLTDDEIWSMTNSNMEVNPYE